MRSPMYVIIEAILFSLCLTMINKALRFLGFDVNYWYVIIGFMLFWIVAKNVLIRFLRYLGNRLNNR